MDEFTKKMFLIQKQSQMPKISAKCSIQCQNSKTRCKSRQLKVRHRFISMEGPPLDSLLFQPFRSCLLFRKHANGSNAQCSLIGAERYPVAVLGSFFFFQVSVSGIEISIFHANELQVKAVQKWYALHVFFYPEEYRT